jgi:hypothetical protein
MNSTPVFKNQSSRKCCSATPKPSCRDIPGNVKIELSRNGGTTWGVLFSNTANDGVQSWVVTGPVTSQARIRVSSLVDARAVDASDTGFNIQ